MALLAFLLAGCSTSQAQERQIVQPTSDLYTLSLVAFVEHGRDPDLKPQRNERGTIVVVENSFITSSMPRTIGQYRIEYLSRDGLRKTFTERKSRFPVIEIAPMRNDGGALMIDLRKYWVSFPKKSTLEMGIEGGWVARWRYDCGQGRFDLASLDAWGI